MRSRLQHIRDTHDDIVIVYTMRHIDGVVRIIVDADYGKKDVQGTGIDAPYGAVTPTLLRGFSEPSVDEDFYTEKWGTFLSAYAPIRDSTGAGKMAVETIALWMFAAIAAVIGVKVIAVTLLNLQAKALSIINERLRDIRIELEHAGSERRMPKVLPPSRIAVRRNSIT